MFKLNSSANFYDDSDPFISQLSPSPSPPTNSNPSTLTSLTSPSSQIIQEQFRQTQECLETSASYMNEIELFFQELSTQRPTPVSLNSTGNNWQSGTTSSLSFDTFDLEHFDFDPSAIVGAIDPSIIFNIKQSLGTSDEEDEENSLDHFNPFISDSANNFNLISPDPSDQFSVIHYKNNNNSTSTSKPSRIRSSKARESKNDFENSPSNSPSSTSSASSVHSASNQKYKTPKFYSRSGQVADPNRGPCHNCHTTLTCYWRKLKGQYHCNACTLFYKRNKYHRSVEEAIMDKPIKRRNRKSKYSSQ